MLEAPVAHARARSKDAETSGAGGVHGEQVVDAADYSEGRSCGQCPGGQEAIGALLSVTGRGGGTIGAPGVRGRGQGSSLCEHPLAV